jgi:hypothetical protein
MSVCPYVSMEQLDSHLENMILGTVGKTVGKIKVG